MRGPCHAPPASSSPHVPHHVVQRGNRRQRVFFAEADYCFYKTTLAEQCAAAKVAIWAWCLMPNHVHLIAVPEDTAGLAVAIGETHKRYTQTVNRRRGWIGHLWQGRFASCPMDEPHTLLALTTSSATPTAPGSCRTPGIGAGRVPAPTSKASTTASPATAPSTTSCRLARLARRHAPRRQTDRLRQHLQTGRPLGDERSWPR